MKITQHTVALISGAGSGLGEATARRLHADGAAVVITVLPVLIVYIIFQRQLQGSVAQGTSR